MGGILQLTGSRLSHEFLSRLMLDTMGELGNVQNPIHNACNSKGVSLGEPKTQYLSGRHGICGSIIFPGNEWGNALKQRL